MRAFATGRGPDRWGSLGGDAGGDVEGVAGEADGAQPCLLADDAVYDQTTVGLVAAHSGVGDRPKVTVDRRGVVGRPG